MRYLRDVYGLAIVLRNQVGTVLQDGHHAESQQVYLNEAHVTDIFLVPLDDVTPWHTRRFDRNNGG